MSRLWTLACRMIRPGNFGPREPRVWLPAELQPIADCAAKCSNLVRPREPGRSPNGASPDHQFPECRGLFQPIWACTMMLNLNPVFTFGGHPSDVQPVDADTVTNNRIGRIFSKLCQRA